MVRRIVEVLAVVVLMAAVLVVASIPAFARPVRGGVPLQNDNLCTMMLAGHPHFGEHPRFAETAPIAPEPGDPPTEAACWHTSPGLLKQFS